jgi:hypothetical protein
MSGSIYPYATDPSAPPISLAPGASSGAQDFTQAGSNTNMSISVALFNATSAASLAAPVLQLQADGGSPLTLSGTLQSVTGTSGYIGSAMVAAQGGNIYLITVLIEPPSPPAPWPGWALTITNTDPANTALCTFAVAADAAGTQIPWMNVKQNALAFTALLNGTPTLAVEIDNYGPGSLPVTTALTSTNAADFTAKLLPSASMAPASSGTLAVSLTAPATAGPLVANLTCGGDPTASAITGHNSQVALSATVNELELAFLLDASGSMGTDGNGDPVPSGSTTDSTRWSLLQSAAAAALATVKNFASNGGTFAVGVYPDPHNLAVPSAADFQPKSPITAANLGNATNAIQAAGPGGNTPMGYGIGYAIGAYFQPYASAGQNDRWLVLMTDGNDNFDASGPTAIDFAGNGTAGAAGQGLALNNIQLAAIGYGNPTATGVAPCNTALLTSLAVGSLNGKSSNFQNAQSDGSSNLIQSFIKSTVFQVLNNEGFTDPAGTLTAAAPTVTRQVMIGDYDRIVSFIVSWSTADRNALIVTVTTPLGEVLESSQAAGLAIDFGDRFRMITVNSAYLANAGGQPRYGLWTLSISLPTRGAPVIGELRKEDYIYQVVNQSDLTLPCTLDKTLYAAGDPVVLTARPSLHGLPLKGASVTVTQTTPGASAINWLANSPVTAAEYEAAAAAASAVTTDTDSLGIKQLALKTKGVAFNPIANTATAPLTDPAGTGTYAITSAGTSVPGTYDFLVTATGTLADGSLFQRQRGITIEITVQADPAATISQFTYLPASGGALQSMLTVWPRDRFGNVVLIDPRYDSTLGFAVTGGSLGGATIDNHDGSYSQIVSYAPGSTPTVTVTVGGVTVVSGVPVASAADLHFVDRVYHFKEGYQAKPGANQHSNPDACLGNFTTKSSPGFVSLGAGGVLVVGFAGHYAQDNDHGQGITVFVQPDQTLRPYSVDAHHGGPEDSWFPIGHSPGVTQTFSLCRPFHLPTARAIRIRDRSGAVLNADGTPSATPGVSILAVGAARLEAGDGGLLDIILNWLEG